MENTPSKEKHLSLLLVLCVLCGKILRSSGQRRIPRSATLTEAVNPTVDNQSLLQIVIPHRSPRYDRVTLTIASAKRARFASVSRTPARLAYICTPHTLPLAAQPWRCVL
jgi:hypothetical protein